jgi:hypothetical protein
MRRADELLAHVRVELVLLLCVFDVVVVEVVAAFVIVLIWLGAGCAAAAGCADNEGLTKAEQNT